MTAASMHNQAAGERQVITLPVSDGLISLRGLSPQRLRFELEYALERGSTANSFLFAAGSDTTGQHQAAVLVHPPVRLTPMCFSRPWLLPFPTTAVNCWWWWVT